MKASESSRRETRSRRIQPEVYDRKRTVGGLRWSIEGMAVALIGFKRFVKIESETFWTCLPTRRLVEDLHFHTGPFP